MSTVSELRLSITRLVDDASSKELLNAAGMAAKKAANDAAKKDLGPDRAMSNFGRRGRVPLGARYDVKPSEVLVVLAPKGAWMLANDGRYKMPPSGRYTTGRGRGKNRKLSTFATPWGPRVSIKASRSRPLGTLYDAEELMEVEVPKAVDAAIAKRILELF